MVLFGIDGKLKLKRTYKIKTKKPKLKNKKLKNYFALLYYM